MFVGKKEMGLTEWDKISKRLELYFDCDELSANDTDCVWLDLMDRYGEWIINQLNKEDEQGETG